MKSLYSALFIVLPVACISDKPSKLPEPEYRQARLPDWAPKEITSQEPEFDDLELDWADDESMNSASAAGSTGTEN